tara:strand:+ start:684 stop:1655 length:972 start_codon:yes stop_codon:yes gene_type:complete
MHIWIYSLVLAVALIAPQLVSSSFAQERLPPPVAKNIKSAAASGQHRSYSLQSAVTMAIVHYPGHVEEIIATAVDAAPQSRDQLVQTMAWAFPNYKGRILAGAGYLETSSSSPASSGQSKPARSSRPVETASNTHQAESDKGLYWGVGGGIANLMDVELVESEDITGDLDVDTGMIVRGVLGYDFANNFRADFELAYRKNDIQNISVTISGISAAGNLYGKITALSYMLNGYYDFDLKGPLKPYLGAGAGLASVEGISDSFSDLSDTVFSYQLMAGLKYPLSPRMSVVGEYKFFNTSTMHFKRGNVSGDYFSHDILLGIAYRF